jgi:hypothetical protein
MQQHHRPPLRCSGPFCWALIACVRGQVSAVIFGFLNVARALVPVRIGLTLATVPLGA